MPPTFSTPSPRLVLLTETATLAWVPPAPPASVWELSQHEPRSTPPLRPAGPAPWLLRLPPSVWHRMRLFLSYRDLHNLVFVSPHFAAVNVVRFLPWDARKAYVLPLDQATKSSNRLACYMCYSLRPADTFQVTGGGRTSQHLYARVVDRNPYTGARILKPVAAPEGAAPPPGPRTRDYDSPLGGWRPNPPGAGVGQIESLGRYCLACALRSRLNEPGDVLHRVAIRDGNSGGRGAATQAAAATQDSGKELEKRWVCFCYRDHGEGSGACPRCSM